ncbi:MAG TPA: protein-L-isoaspartate(D-aspartate) O-methyltransferase [Spongiibacteraceae bacterium]|nr:protein-L-isoaspartate(D-aspartate) O-methyltransferase [Spongiibacteraceae bacterium]
MTSQRTRDRMMQRLREQGIRNIAVLDLMRSTPRHIFLDEALAQRAYEDSALPIGYQQTLSQPYIVARMTELLFQSGSRARILEIGTGSGYQTAILANMPGVDRVFSVERIQPLQDKARQRLRLLKIYNVNFRMADGAFGWPDQGPFDGILSAAAPQDIPEELVAQLADGGRLVIPVGDEQEQQLIVVDRIGDEVTRTVIEPVRFVPLLGGTIRK